MYWGAYIHTQVRVCGGVKVEDLGQCWWIVAGGTQTSVCVVWADKIITLTAPDFHCEGI